MDTIPDVLYQSIFSYLLGDEFDHEFFSNYRRVLLVNKVFQKCVEHYVKKTPFQLYFCTEHRLEMMEALNVIRNVNKYDITIYDLELKIHGFMLNGLKLSSSLRRFSVNNRSLLGDYSLPLGNFYWPMLKDCTKLTSIFIDCGDIKYGKQHYIKNLLFSNKNTLEDLTLFTCDIDKIHFLQTDMSWPNLKKLSIMYYRDFRAPNQRIVHIKCPNLQRLFIKALEGDLVDNDLDLEDLADADLDLLDRTDRDSYKYKTCSVSELRHIGIVADVSEDCNIILEVRVIQRRDSDYIYSYYV